MLNLFERMNSPLLYLSHITIEYTGCALFQAISAHDQLMGDSGVREKVQLIEAKCAPSSKRFGKFASGAVTAVAKVSGYANISGAIKLGFGAARMAGTAAKKGIHLSLIRQTCSFICIV